MIKCLIERYSLHSGIVSRVPFTTRIPLFFTAALEESSPIF